MEVKKGRKEGSQGRKEGRKREKKGMWKQEVKKTKNSGEIFKEIKKINRRNSKKHSQK